MAHTIKISKEQPMNHDVYHVTNEAGEIVKSFDELSNDYAWTSATKLMNELNKKEM